MCIREQSLPTHIKVTISKEILITTLVIANQRNKAAIGLSALKMKVSD